MQNVYSTDEAAEVLLRLLEEKATVVLDADQKAPTRPFIRTEEGGRYVVVVEGTEVAEDDTLKGAMLLFFAAHYVLHQKVGAPTKSTMWMLSTCLGVHPESKATPSAAKNLAELEV